MQIVYLEYQIIRNRPGLLGDVTSLMGLLNINILMVNGVSGDWRCFLLEGNKDKITALNGALEQITNIEVTVIREPEAIDLVTVRHGQHLNIVKVKPMTFRFLRQELGLLIDFLGELLRDADNMIIGIKGMPRVGKTEAAIAGCVNANKRWVLVSSTIIRQHLRNNLSADELHGPVIYLIDGITSTSRGSSDHWELLRQVMRLNKPKIIEHPDIFLRDGLIDEINFDYIFELMHSPTDDITVDKISSAISAFDIS